MMIHTSTCTTPRFITFEGTEGVGKTTAIDGLCERLTKQRVAHIRTREPGGSPLAEQLRAILLDRQTEIHDETELLLMFCARSDHLHRVILPALAQGKWVVCDRFTDSTVAYQGFGRYGGEPQQLAKIAQLIAHFVPCLPDVTFWLDLDPNIGMRRAGKRSAADRFEQLKDGFFGRTYQGFVHQYKQYPERICRIDAAQTADAVVADIWAQLEHRIAGQ